MRTSSAIAVDRSTETDRTSVRFVPSGEQSFGSILGQVARLLWPSKTAAHVAAAAGCGERAAEMYLAGDREWSGAALACIVAEVLKRHSMRSVKIVAR